jgi:hypothetical protein
LSHWQIKPPQGPELCVFKLYFGIFDMQAIAQFANGLPQ